MRILLLIPAILIGCGPALMAQSVSSGTSGSGPGINSATSPGFQGETLQGVNTPGQSILSGESGFIGQTADAEFVGDSAVESEGSRINRIFRDLAQQEIVSGSTSESTAAPRRIPVRLRLAFPRPTPHQATQLAGSGRIDLKSVSRIRPELASVRTIMDDQGNVTLSGQVPTAAASRLAANLIRLQPGVRKVRNNLTLPTQ